YYAGVDWGYDHYGSIVILGEDEAGNTYILDGIAEQYKEIDWWVERAKRFQGIYGDMMFYADSARPEHVARFKRDKLRTINADKSVIAGIEEVAKRFKEERLFYIKGSLPRFEDEIIKEYDDVLDAIRYAVYSKDKKKVTVQLFKHGI